MYSHRNSIRNRYPLQNRYNLTGVFSLFPPARNDKKTVNLQLLRLNDNLWPNGCDATDERERVPTRVPTHQIY